MLRARYKIKNSCHHASVFRIRRRTHHEVQVLNEEAEPFRISTVFPYYFYALGLINQANASVTNRNRKYVDIRQKSKATSPLVILKDYDPPVATATLLLYI